MADDTLDSTIKSVAARIEEAARGLVTVEVRTLIGNTALAANASKANTIAVAEGTEGAYTACNMATGDIITCFSDGVAKPEQAKALHDEAVKLGTEIFRQNITMLKQVLFDLIDKQRSTGG
jgi:hypothetical protein